MKSDLVPIDHAGRIVLPKGVREELAIRPGDRFRVSVNGLAVTLTPSKDRSGFVRKGRALVFSASDGAALGHDAVEKLLDEDRKSTAARTAVALHGRKIPS